MIDTVDVASLTRKLNAVLGEGRIYRNVDLAPYTTFRIGGPADLFIEPSTSDDLASVLEIIRESGMPHFVLGLGANILVADAGFRGVVIRNCVRHIAIDSEQQTVVAGSGAVIYPDVIDATVSASLGGLEHYVGIPSTVGGALWQNLHFLSPAPARERTMFIEEVLKAADILETDGTRHTVGPDYFNFGYDYSILHDNGAVVLEATFQLTPEDEVVLRRTMNENLEWRHARHPPLDTEPSAGSIFQKIEGVGAGRLIDEAGLKGTRVGGAEVTERHANILINRDRATAADVVRLITYIQETVHRRTGFWLKPEIGFVGEFDIKPSASAR